LRIVLADPLSYEPPYLAALQHALPDHKFFRWPDIDPGFDHHVLVAWDIPSEMQAFAPSLRVIFCFAAGTDQLLIAPRLAITAPVARLIDHGQADQLLDYAMHAAFARLQDEFDVHASQQQRLWRPAGVSRRRRGDLRIAVLGLGIIGAHVAHGLALAGFRVSGWSRSFRAIDGVTCFHGETGLLPCADGADLLVNLLPSNAQTHEILSAPMFDRLAIGAWLVNLGRGEQLDETALAGALESGRVGGAWLDVFAVEPLPRDHWMWAHPRVRVTPHRGGLPTPEGTAKSLKDLVAAIERGDAVLPGQISAGC
jgi:glyoxylate/hydroxypyruvate reductase A